YDRDTVIQGEIECLGRVSGRMLDLERGPDWRTEAEKARPFSPAAQHYVDHGLETLRLPWTPAAANHVWTCYANYRQAEAEEGFLPTPSPRFLNGPNSMLAASGETVTLAKRATAVDVGVELGCVVGKLAFGIQEADADGYIQGYAPVISLSDHSFREQIVEPSTPQEKNICQV
ncbi:MAG TPA: fumarylacetoacetate hydrolase family protein, partial [Clostridia bacterium]|nr:fumarylacetoacetate hydrolase family protein [Clostridia bacterium]